MNIVTEVEDEYIIFKGDTEIQILECIEVMLYLMDEYMNENLLFISDEGFTQDFEDNILELFLTQFEDCENEEVVEDLIEHAFELFYVTFFPKRSINPSIIIDVPNVPVVYEKIETLKNKYQPLQRSNEWYEYRHNLITASNAYKIFESQSLKNSLIYEKCKPLEQSKSDNCVKETCVNIDNSLGWGQRYETVSVMIYEDMYDTTIGDFGCIRHPEYHCLGASPDGINVNNQSERYGRMLEIKNIVNRKIDGNPKREYWVQMQLQMETCDLDECDFLETKFLEYENEHEFLNDSDDFIQTQYGELKGIIMYFVDEKCGTVYKYKPLKMGKAEFIEWEKNNMSDNNVTWIKNIYWRIDVLSCVLVERNKEWFKNNIVDILKFWEIIKCERVEGYAHRAPNSRIKPDSTVSSPVQLIRCGKDGKVEITTTVIDMSNII
jgi:hypothetical protein